MSRALKGMPGVKKSNMAQYKAPGIVKYVDLSASLLGYAFFFYKNDDEDLTYEETLTFTKFVGAELMEPFKG